ncbi:Oligopeptide ABC transporter, periplasmic oligopeptide-binding protein OppA (TC 3.A.1.5.1) [hydrothermal vent metagenome]|uniref:Oligopeptide ABC transporter, periplasmic oligopeptide-binding protein OppA (TC 3.A.1.5.1) n=1 Tax=hydrothermal vent metagenome TaxID=652676 RepID=A0A3B0VWD3_9ZZZZ
MAAGQNSVFFNRLSPAILISRILVISCLLLLASCGQNDSSSEQARFKIQVPEIKFIDGRPDPSILAEKQILRKGNGSQPQTLDPHKGEGVPGSNIQRDLFEGLLAKAPNGDLIPGVATSWDFDEANLTYRFKIRDNAYWSDGTRLTAYDCEYGLQRSLDPKTGSKYTAILAPILNAEKVASGELDVSELGVKALDDTTLVIQLKSPTPYFLGLLTHATASPMHKISSEKYGDSVAKVGNLVSNGAYKLVESVIQSHIKLVRNEHYWDNENTIIDEVIYYPIEDQSSELKRYRAGELDFTNEVPNNQFKWIKANLKDELVIRPWLGIYYYGFNLTKPPFKDNLNLRLALSMTIDREIITGKVTQFGEQPAYAFVPPGIGNYQPQNPKWASWSKEEKLTEALRLYKKAGYTKTNPLEVELRYNTSENHKKTAIAIAAMWKQALGVRTHLINEEWKVFLSNRKLKKVTQIFRAGWISDYNDPYSFLELLYSQHGINDSGYNSSKYDELLSQSANEFDQDKRLQIMYKAEQTLLQDQPVIPIFSYVVKRLIKPYIGGVGSNIMDHHHTKDWYILKHEIIDLSQSN